MHWHLEIFFNVCFIALAIWPGNQLAPGRDGQLNDWRTNAEDITLATIINPSIVLIINPLVTTNMDRSYWYELGHFLPGEKSVCQLSGVRLYDGEDRVCINNVFII